MALVLVTHDLGVVDELCNKVVVMREGAVMEAGSTSDVLGAPQSSYTQTLLESRLPLPTTTRQLTVNTEGGGSQ